MRNRNQSQIIIVGIVIVAAIVVAGIAIFLNSNNTANSLDYSNVPFSRTSDGAFLLGNPNAPITVVEFADFGCPHCLDYEGDMNRFIKDYVFTGKSMLEFRVFPTAGGAVTAYMGQVVDCADQQKPGVFWPMHDFLFNLTASGQYSEKAGSIAAAQFNLDYSKILTCAQNSKRTDTDVQLGQQVNIQGTPAIVVRYGTSAPQFISIAGRVYNQGGVPYDILASVVTAAQTSGS
jgi:protein-disulfide isomerase